MAKHTIPYAEFNIPATAPFPSGQVVHRPLIVVRLTTNGGNRFFCLACVDSGADQCVFPQMFAAPLGLDPLRMKQQLTGGVGNTGNITYYENIHIDAGLYRPDANGKYTVFDVMASFETYAGFTAGLDAQGIGLLGQVGMFENFAISFDHKNRVFHIQD